MSARASLVGLGRGLLHGLLAALSLSAAIAAFVTLWELIENPGGIFRHAEGTQWGFVWDTAVSWLVPTFLYVATVAALLHLGVSAVVHVVRKARSSSSRS